MIAHRYSPEEVAWVRKNHTLSVKEMPKRFAENFGRTPGICGLVKKRNSVAAGLPRKNSNKHQKKIGTEKVKGGYIYRMMTQGKEKMENGSLFIGLGLNNQTELFLTA